MDLIRRYQREILAFANTGTGKDYLGIKTKDRIVRITPESWHSFLGIQNNKYHFKSTFFSKSPIYKKLNLALTSMNLVEEGFKKFRFSRLNENLEFVIAQYLGLSAPKAYLPKIYLTEDTFNPDAHPETSSVDGWVRSSNANDTWGNQHDAADGTNADDSNANTPCAYINGGTSTDRFSGIWRGFFLFNTASIPDTNVVSSAVFSVYVTAVVDQFGSSSLCLVSSNPATNTALVTADYDQLGTTQFAADKTLASFSTSAYNDFTLNATGIAAIILTGVSKYGTRLSYDRTNTAPTWGSGYASAVTIYYADQGSNQPKLVVTHDAPASGFSSYKSLLGVGG